MGRSREERQPWVGDRTTRGCQIAINPTLRVCAVAGSTSKAGIQLWAIERMVVSLLEARARWKPR